MGRTPPEIEEISHEELDALISRVEYAIQHELSLSVEDLKLLLLAIHTLSRLQAQLESSDVTIFKLKKLLGLVKQSEQGKSILANAKNNQHQKNKKKKRRPSKPKNKAQPKVEYHALAKLHQGDACPHCGRGKLYKFEPGRLLRVSGHAPFEATQHITERVRCNACLTVIGAELSETILADGEPNQQYGYSARALMALQKFYSGTPYYHQGNVSGMFGLSLSASTIFDQVECVANGLFPVFHYLKQLAANAKLFLVDDTPNRILEQQPELREKRRGGGTQLRTGIYSSGLIAFTDEDREIVLFETSLGHAGEWLDEILEKRDPMLAPPIVMSDALSRNTPSKITVKSAYCNAHCRREFFDLHDKYPESVEYVIETYSRIWENEAKVKEKKLTATERLTYHREHSLPIMQELKDWAQTQQASNHFEENSAWGKAIRYLLRHYDKLILFCTEPWAPLDNNRMEETLKMIIRNRKTAHFFKTTTGAAIANVVTSLVATGLRAEINLLDYFVVIQRHADCVRKNPERWLPWNYQIALRETEKIKSSSAAQETYVQTRDPRAPPNIT